MDALFHKGIELAELGNHKQSIEIFDKILSKHKDNVNVIYAKSRSNAAIGEIDQSFELLKKAVSKNPKAIKQWAKQEKIFESLLEDERFRRIIK
jgi:tetratricopeptide (TPR) repeat protein